MNKCSYVNIYFNMKLPIKDCVVNEYFKDAINSNEKRLEYCNKNCVKRCLNNMEYKKRNE